MAHPHQNLYVTPSTLEVDYDRNLTELYQAITDQKWDLAVSICKKHPVQAATWVVRHYEDDGEIMWRFLPIHSACARQPPPHVVQALLKAYPDGAKCIDDQGMYALHYACGNQASRDVIRLLLVNFPEAAKIPDPRGMLPIHYLACWGPSSVSVVDMLLVANREVANARDEEGNTPLDLAKEGDYPERHAVISALRKWINDSHSMRSTGHNSILATAASASTRKGRNGGGKHDSSVGPYTMDKLTVDISVDEEEKKDSESDYYNQSSNQPKSTRSASPYDQKHRGAMSPTAVEKLEDQIKQLQQQLSEKIEKQSLSGSTKTGSRYTKSSNKSSSIKADAPSAKSYAESSSDERDGNRSRSGTEEEITRLQQQIRRLKFDMELSKDQPSKEKKERELDFEENVLKDAWKHKYEQSEKHFRIEERNWKEKLEDAKKKAEDRESELLREMRQLEKESKDLRKQLEESRDTAEEKTKAMDEKDEEIEDLKKKLESSKSERDGLRTTLGDLMEQHDNFKKKSHQLTDRLGSLSVSLESMMDQQRTLTKALQARNEQYRDVFKRRQDKLKELEELEKDMAKDEDKLEVSLDKQMKEMEAIAAVIAAARE